MASRVDVSNLALSKIGEDFKLTDPTDPEKPAVAIAACWDMVRRRVLRSAAWNFAIRRFALPQLAGIDPDSIHPYTAAFQLPIGSLRLVELLDTWLTIDDWQVEGRQILVRRWSGPLRVRCVVDIENVEDWDDLAIEALASALAFQISDEITGDESRKTAARADGKEAMSSAKVMDAVENPPIEPEEDDWILARFR